MENVASYEREGGRCGVNSQASQITQRVGNEFIGLFVRRTVP